MSASRLLTLGAAALLLGTARGDELPATARRLIDEADKQIQEIEKKAQTQVAARRKKLLADLKALEESFTKEAKFAQAAAVRARIREIEAGPLVRAARPDPGTLTNFRGQVGKSFVFEVTGGMNGSCWGTGVYTDDSTLATACVHAGVLKVGQKGLVKVTVLPGQASYPSSTQHGVNSGSWNAWNGSFRVERVKP